MKEKPVEIDYQERSNLKPKSGESSVRTLLWSTSMKLSSTLFGILDTFLLMDPKSPHDVRNKPIFYPFYMARELSCH